MTKNNNTIVMTSIIAMTLVFAGSLSMNSAEAATGDILANYTGSCFGIAFNGTHLWCSGLGDTTLDVIETSTGIVSTDELVINPAVPVVALAYDHNSDVLWGNIASAIPNQNFTKIDPSTGNILANITTTIPPEFGWSDGLSYDEITDTLWASPEDGGVSNNVYEVDPKNGDVLQTLNFPNPDLGWSGIAVTGDSMWMDNKTNSIDQFNMTGDSTALTIPRGENSEDLAFDDQTFDGKCAIWAATTLIAYEIPCPTIEKVCDEYNGVEICKTADIKDNDGFYTVGEIIEFDFAIEVHTNSTTLTNVQVKDRLGGDLMSVDNSLETTDNLTCTLGTPNAGNNPNGKKKGGVTEKEFLDCEATPADELPPNSWEEITFTAKTDINPGQQKQQEKGNTPKNEYTSCGVHEINSGATLQFWFFGENPDVDEPTELKTPAISVDVFDESYPESDCDEDGVDDPVDLCPFEGIEILGAVDLDGCPVEP
jgi:hypothetical protein